MGPRPSERASVEIVEFEAAAERLEGEAVRRPETAAKGVSALAPVVGTSTAAGTESGTTEAAWYGYGT